MPERRPPTPPRAPRRADGSRPEQAPRTSQPQRAPQAPRTSQPKKAQQPKRSQEPTRAGKPPRAQQSGKDVAKARSHAPARAQRQQVVASRVQESPWEKVAPDAATTGSVSLRMQERLAERKRTERRRAMSRGGKFAVIAAAVVAVVWVIAASPLFALDGAKIELAGVSGEIDAGEVDALLDSHVGDSLLTMNVPHIANQLRDITGVRDATVERVWPQGLRVTLVARDPVAAIPSGEQFVLLDADAVEVGTVDAVPAGLPVMDVPLGDARVLDAALAVIRSLPATVLERVEGLGAHTEDSVTFSLRDGPRVEWGSADDSALKAQVLTVLLDSGQAPAGTVVDVSAPTLPITRSGG